MDRGWNRSRFSHASGDHSAMRRGFFPPLTPAIKLLAIVLGVAYLLEIVWVHWVAPPLLGLDGGGPAGVMGPLLALHLGLVPRDLVHGHLWQAVSYLLLHDPVHPSHLLFNLLMLWIFGAELEAGWGTRRFLRIFLLCGLGGALGVLLLALVFSSEWGTLVYGASGAVYGVMAAYGTIFKERVLWPIPIRAKHLVLIIVGLTVLSFLVRSDESFGAHLGGLVTGVLLTRQRRPRKPRRTGRKRDARLFVVHSDVDGDQGRDAGSGKMLN